MHLLHDCSQRDMLGVSLGLVVRAHALLCVGRSDSSSKKRRDSFPIRLGLCSWGASSERASSVVLAA